MVATGEPPSGQQDVHGASKRARYGRACAQDVKLNKGSRCEGEEGHEKQGDMPMFPGPLLCFVGVTEF